MPRIGIPDAFASFDQLPDSAYVRAPTVCALFNISNATVWRWVAAKRLPTPKKLGPQTTAWQVGDLRATQAAVQAQGAA
jgi:prophage regulatory protein